MPDLSALFAALDNLAAAALSTSNGAGDGYSVPGMIVSALICAVALVGTQTARRGGGK